VAKPQFAASQMDWAALQADHSAWLGRVRRAFATLDADGDGVASVEEIAARLSLKLPLSEARARCPFCWAPLTCAVFLTMTHAEALKSSVSARGWSLPLADALRGNFWETAKASSSDRQSAHST
jgi:hypothetical protein